MTSREFAERLNRRARKAGIDIPAALAERLEIYYRLLSTWNTRINLTALDLSHASDEAFDRLLIEPLVAATHVPEDAVSMMDVGSGGGSPAIPFKLAAPHLSLLMVESKTRKSVFLREAARALALPDAVVETSRFEALLARPDLHEGVDLVTIRAVRVELRVLMSIQSFIRPGGQLFLFRAGRSSEPPSVPTLLDWRATYPLVESSDSKLVVLSKR